MDYCLAVREGNTVLYSILSRIVGSVPESTVNAALTYYSVDNSLPSFGAFILAYPIPAILSAVAAIILIILAIRGLRVQKKAGEQPQPPRT